jgi:transcriptional regulator with XRE-family HTH domain
MTDYLSGKRKPSPKMMQKLCKYFKVPPSAIEESEYPWTKEIAELRATERRMAEVAVANRQALDRQLAYVPGER